jgi:hypothetical protein
MNRKQLMLILAALVVVGTAGLILIKQHRESWNSSGAQMGARVLPNFRPNEVAAIRIKGNSELHLVHSNDLWRVSERNDYPANFGRISDVLIKLQGLKVVESETVEPSQLARVNLESPGNGPASGTLVELKDNQGKILDALMLGKKHFREQGESAHAVVAPEPDGRYILLRSNPQNVLLISDALASFEPRPEAWLSSDFFKAEKAKSISASATDEANSWKISRESESSPWTLADAKTGEALDVNKAERIINTLGTITFSDVFPADTPAHGSFANPVVVSIETFDHFAYTLKVARAGDQSQISVAVKAGIPTERVKGIGEKPEDREKLDTEFRAQMKNLQEKLVREQALGPWVYVINSWVIDPLIQPRAQIMQGYKDEKAVDAAKTEAAADPKKKAAWTPNVIQ